jgi:crotonobetainyl-CoA:carnitine CoA-transferase CaiB-like acyl-CoA transferase
VIAPSAAVVDDWLLPFGLEPRSVESDPESCQHLAWAGSGAMYLSGASNGPPAFSRGAVIPLLTEVLDRVARLGGADGRRIDLDASVVLGARSAAGAGSRQGRISVGGSARLLRTVDGWCALNLSRADDIAAIPALLEEPAEADVWEQLTREVVRWTAAELCARAALLGIPAAVLNDEPAPVRPWRTVRVAPTVPVDRDGALVVDLSSLWAGPLCAHVLGQTGARVVKVESTGRPDSARLGNRRLFDWLHAGHSSVSLDFTRSFDQRRLAALVRAADVVIEASRPRALAQLGLSPEADLKPGAVWVSITGRGRRVPEAVAFGDDAAVSGGLVAMGHHGPVFSADAIADPLTGVVAALGALAARRAGGGLLIDVAMSAVAEAFAASVGPCAGEHRVIAISGRWHAECSLTGQRQVVARPQAPVASAPARACGADTAAVLAEYCSELAGDQGAVDERRTHTRRLRIGEDLADRAI